MEPLLRGIHHNEETGYTRQVKPGKEVKSIWDVVTDERLEFKLFDLSSKKVTSHSNSNLAQTPYMFYKRANELEDAILFPDKLTAITRMLCFERSQMVSRISKVVFYPAGFNIWPRVWMLSTWLKIRLHEEVTIWGVPNFWATGLVQARKEKPHRGQKALLEKTGLMRALKSLNFDRRMGFFDPMEIMERDRSFSKFPSHNVQLDTDRRSSAQCCKQNTRVQQPGYGTSFLDWPGLKCDYAPDEYVQDPQALWPYSFVVQDIVYAFAMTVIFSPTWMLLSW